MILGGVHKNSVLKQTTCTAYTPMYMHKSLIYIMGKKAFPLWINIQPYSWKFLCSINALQDAYIIIKGIEKEM